MIELADVIVDAATPGQAPGVKRILGPVSLTLNEPRIAIIGANGSGKTTLARLLNGLINPTSGTVRVCDLDPAHKGKQVRKQVGFVFSDPSASIIMPTPREDIELSLRRLPLTPAQRRERANQILTDVGLHDRAEVSCSALSGGQRQLLALAGVLAAEPEIVVCDEPTTLLDLLWKTRIENILDQASQQIIQVTHDLTAAARAHRVIVIDNGQVLADGPPQGSINTYRDHMLARA